MRIVILVGGAIAIFLIGFIVGYCIGAEK